MGTPINSITLLIHLAIHMIDISFKGMKKTGLGFYGKKLFIAVKKYRSGITLNPTSIFIINIFNKLPLINNYEKTN